VNANGVQCHTFGGGGHRASSPRAAPWLTKEEGPPVKTQYDHILAVQNPARYRSALWTTPHAAKDFALSFAKL